MGPLAADASTLILIDFQARLVPAIAGGAAAVANAARLLAAARRLGVPVLATEQVPAKLGATVPEIAVAPAETIAKATFAASGAPGFGARLPFGRTAVVAGIEAHVCVLQTVLALRGEGRAVAVVADAVGSRTDANRDAALARMSRAGAEIVTTEMVVFEWLGTAEHPAFRELSALIR